MDIKPQKQDKAKELIYNTPEFSQAYKEGRVILENRYDPVEDEIIYTVRPVAEKPTSDPRTNAIAYGSPEFWQAYKEGRLILVSRYDPLEWEDVGSFKLADEQPASALVDPHEDLPLFEKQEEKIIVRRGIPSLRHAEKKPAAPISVPSMSYSPSSSQKEVDTHIEEIQCMNCGTINHVTTIKTKFGDGTVLDLDCTRCNKNLMVEYARMQTTTSIKKEEDTTQKTNQKVPPTNTSKAEAAPLLPKPQTSQIPSEKDTSQKQENVSAPQQRQAPTGYTLLGIDTQTNERVQITQASRRQGLYIIGANGTGKTGLIENLILQDINQGLGVGLLDPHGDLIKAILAKMTKRLDDVILLDINDYQYPFGLNLFTCSDPNDDGDVSRATNKVMHIFKKLWGKGGIVVEDAWGVTLEEILANATMTFLEYSQYEVFTMAEIPLLLEDAEFRSHIIQKLTNRHVKDYWVKKYNKLSDKDQLEERRSTLNRVRAFLTKAIVENIVGQAKTTIDFRTAMDERKIVLVKLDRRMEDVTSLIGSMLIAEILNAAYSRESLPVDKRKQFNLYADEFQLFATEDFATLLTEARKFGIATTIAHQARYQPGMTDGIRAVSLQAANQVVFRVTSPDADELAGGFDITPQEAWEEELEEEWVEVLKEEWFERVEEDVIEASDEPVIIYDKNIVSQLLRQHHPHPDVQNFVSKYLKNIDRASKIPPDPYRDRSSSGLVGLKMTYPAPDDYVTSGSPDYKGWFEKRTRNYHYKYTDLEEALTYINDVLYDEMSGKDIFLGVMTPGHDYELVNSDCYYTMIGLLEGYLGYSNYWQVYFGFSEIDRQLVLDYLQKQEELVNYYNAHMKNYNGPNYEILKKRRDEAYEKIPQSTQSKIVSKDLPVLKMEGQRCKDFMASIKAAARGLREYPMQTKDSGRYQPRTRKQINILTHPRETITHPRVAITHPQRAYQDVQNDIANQLSGLPNFTARVKISEIVSHNPGKKCLSCKLLNNLGAKICSKCGTKLPAPNEYTLTTLKPLGGLGKAAFDQRIANIQTRNRDPRYGGYCRSRKEVEAEITKRQTDSSGGSAPAQPQQPSPQQQQARYARQVPLKKNCQNCGTQNDSDAKFCNQCGTKLT